MKVGCKEKHCLDRITERVLSVMVVELAGVYIPCLKLHAQFAKSGKGQIPLDLLELRDFPPPPFSLHPTYEEPMETHLYVLTVSLPPPNRQVSAGGSRQ